MRLRIGLGPAGKALATLAALFILMIAATLAAAVTPGLPFLPTVLGLPVDDAIADVPPAVRPPFLLLSLALAVGAFAGLLKAYRCGVFLDHTVVTVRTTFRTQVIDLARVRRFRFDQRREQTTSQQANYQVTTTFTVPLLCAVGPHGTVRIPLAYHGVRLPHGELEALAGAIETGGPRPAPHGHEAQDAADALRRMARSVRA